MGERMELQGKTLIVTGASLGIGRALELAGRGVNLVLNARHAPALEGAAAAAAALGVEVRPVAGNAANRKPPRHWWIRPWPWGVLRLYPCRRCAHPGPLLWELSERKFQEILDSQVTAAYQLIRAAVPALLQQGEGLAVFFGSGAATTVIPGIGAYCAAKAAEEHLARELAAEAPAITSFVFRPPATETRMQRQARKSTGGGAATLHRRFGGYKDRGELSTPEAQAKALLRILINQPRRFPDTIAD